MAAVVVIGCGVNGLSSAVLLAEAGHDVTIWARDLPPNTTSNIAAAIWYPYKAEPQLKVRPWGVETLKELARLAEIPHTGVRLVSGRKYFHRRMGPPWWKESVSFFRLLTRHEVPEGYAAGYETRLPVADMSRYLYYLIQRFQGANGTIARREITCLEAAFKQASVVVNCSGLGARSLLGDETLFPIRGQVVRTGPLASTQFLLDSDNPQGMIYVIPRGNDCILGGVAEPGNWNNEPDAVTGREILARCTAAVPALAGTPVLAHLAGLRPGRPSVRLQRERFQDKVVIHNYGHGGSGVTLSWGCAQEVLSLVSSAVSEC